MKTLKIIILLILLVLIPVNSYSWGEKGHAFVAEIAFKYLDKNTKKMVRDYLDGMTIEEAANWMDVIKKDKKYDNLKALHYVNFEKNEEVKNICCDNIISALTTCILNLKNYKNLSKEDVKTNLCYLFHLMGDLHQPLHIGYGSDKGGNTFQVHFDGKGTNLHALYDYKIIEFKKVSFKQCLKEKNYSKTEIDAIQKIDVVNWATDSRKYLGTIYNVENNIISDDYVNENLPIIKSQIHLAGIRLAGVLKEVFSTN